MAEGHVEILAVLRARLEVLNVVVLGELGGHVLIHFDVIDQVDFVAQHDYLGVGVGPLPDLLQPVAHILETVLVGHIVHKHDSCGSFVVGMGEGPKLNLARRVPNGHFHARVQVDDILLLVVDSCCTDQIALVNSVGVSVKKTALADASVAKQRDFDLVVSHLVAGHRVGMVAH